MNALTMHAKLAVLALSLLLAAAKPSPAAAGTGPGVSVFSHDDQYILIEAGVVPAGSDASFGLEIGLTPKPGWKVLVDNSSGTKPLRLKFSPGKCLKLKGKTRIPAPDLAGNDESGAYSEYYTGHTVIRQDFGLACGPKRGGNGMAALTYLLCQNNRCVGPFVQEIRFSAPDRK